MPNTRNIHLTSSNLGIFFDTIISDFGTILNNNNMTMIDMVERCINKKQYQQALTFLESAFPDFIEIIILFPSLQIRKNQEIFNEFLKNNIRFNSPRKNVNRFCSMLQRRMEMVKTDQM